MTRLLFIINPTAGKKDRTEELTAEITSLSLGERGRDYDILVTEAPKDATKKTLDYIAAHEEDFIKIYACGGDGTLCEVAEGVYRSGSKKVAVGVLPLGSGNDFVKAFDKPTEVFRSIKNQANGRYKSIDVLSITDKNGEDRISLNIVSAGFDAAVCKGMDKFKKWPLVSGSLAYKLSLVQCVFTKRKNHFDLKLDGNKVGDKKDPYLFAIAANGRYYGGGFKASPYSVLEDGLLDFVRIDSVSLFKFFSLVGKFRAGKHIDEMKDLVLYEKGTVLEIISENEVDINVDGEIIPMKDPVISLVPKAINIIIPR